MKRLFRLLAVLSILLAPGLAMAAPDPDLTIAAAADLHHAMDDLVAAFRAVHPDSNIKVVYGSSGMLTTQIEQGAPFDLFFSADSDYPAQLVAAGQAVGKPTPYAEGHIVIWSASLDMRGVRIEDLAEPRFGRIAIASPEHAPYGKRARQALTRAGLWDELQPRLVYGENIAQAAQYAQSGAATVGVIAQSLVLNPAMKGSFSVVPSSAYDPLIQSFVLTRRGAGDPTAQAFARFVQTAPAKAILRRYGFTMTGD